jgi:hypothetical protein
LNYLLIAGNVARVPASDVASRIRELARRLESVADGLGTQTTRSDLDRVIADLRILVIREFGRKPRAARGDVYVRDGGNLTLCGMIIGTLTVGIGGYADVRGMVDGLVVRDAGRAELHGTCHGDASNLGGELVVKGTVGGSVVGYTTS